MCDDYIKRYVIIKKMNTLQRNVIKQKNQQNDDNPFPKNIDNVAQLADVLYQGMLVGKGRVHEKYMKNVQLLIIIGYGNKTKSERITVDDNLRQKLNQNLEANKEYNLSRKRNEINFKITSLYEVETNKYSMKSYDCSYKVQKNNKLIQGKIQNVTTSGSNSVILVGDALTTTNSFKKVNSNAGNVKDNAKEDDGDNYEDEEFVDDEEEYENGSANTNINSSSNTKILKDQNNSNTSFSKSENNDTEDEEIPEDLEEKVDLKKTLYQNIYKILNLQETYDMKSGLIDLLFIQPNVVPKEYSNTLKYRDDNQLEVMGKGKCGNQDYQINFASIIKYIDFNKAMMKRIENIVSIIYKERSQPIYQIKIKEYVNEVMKLVDIRDCWYSKYQQKQVGGVRFNKKLYVVKTDKDGKYIRSKTKIYLSSIKGRYRYFK